MNPYAAYKKQSVTTMTPIEIVIKLYSETERELNRAVIFIEEKNYENANKSLNKSVDLIAALGWVKSLLPMVGELKDAFTQVGAMSKDEIAAQALQASK